MLLSCLSANCGRALVLDTPSVVYVPVQVALVLYFSTFQALLVRLVVAARQLLASLLPVSAHLSAVHVR
jgi:hypothetical protein